MKERHQISYLFLSKDFNLCTYQIYCFFSIVCFLYMFIMVLHFVFFLPVIFLSFFLKIKLIYLSLSHAHTYRSIFKNISHTHYLSLCLPVTQDGWVSTETGVMIWWWHARDIITKETSKNHTINKSANII